MSKPSRRPNREEIKAQIKYKKTANNTSEDSDRARVAS